MAIVQPTTDHKSGKYFNKPNNFNSFVSRDAVVLSVLNIHVFGVMLVATNSKAASRVKGEEHTVIHSKKKN